MRTDMLSTLIIIAACWLTALSIIVAALVIHDRHADRRRHSQ